MSDNDTLYIVLNDHGSPNALCLWYVNMSNTDFGNEVNKVTRYSQMVIQMKQCYSGSFIPPLTRARRTVMSSCAANQVSYGHPSNQFGEFTYWYFSALTGQKPDGSGSVNADSNNNRKISILEAYNFARSHDQAPETPHFEDNGVVPAVSGQVPSGGDGNRSASIYLTGIEAAAGSGSASAGGGGAGRTDRPPSA
ncbi:MAG: C13 family peptidase [Thermodesulfobacteriota bacterium]